MIMHPGFDPVAISIGPVAVHWYGLMYLVGFVGGYFLGVMRARRPGSEWSEAEVGDILFYIAIGVIVGGRLGYILFYNLDHYVSNPAELLYIWRGGMSFHGGLLGVIAAMWWFGRKTGKGFWKVADFIAPLTPLGLFAGRIGNFINQELWGSASNLPWAMVFPLTDPGMTPRHPSMLYEALLEGLALFLLLWLYSRKSRPVGAVAAAFLMGYGFFRFIVEFFRQPDAHIGYLAFDWLTMGQILSVPMLLIGAMVYLRSHNRPEAEA